MARLGAALGVTPMALYRHFPSKAELVDAILDRFVREAAVTGHGVPRADRRAWLARTFGEMHRALVGTPGVMPYLSSGWRFGEHARSVLDEVLGVLHAAGLSRRAAAEAMSTLLAFTIGSAGLAAAWGRTVPARPRARRTRRAPPPPRAPTSLRSRARAIHTSSSPPSTWRSSRARRTPSKPASTASSPASDSDRTPPPPSRIRTRAPSTEHRAPERPPRHRK